MNQNQNKRNENEPAPKRTKDFQYDMDELHDYIFAPLIVVSEEKKKMAKHEGYQHLHKGQKIKPLPINSPQKWIQKSEPEKHPIAEVVVNVDLVAQVAEVAEVAQIVTPLKPPLVQPPPKVHCSNIPGIGTYIPTNNIFGGPDGTWARNPDENPEGRDGRRTVYVQQFNVIPCRRIKPAYCRAKPTPKNIPLEWQPQRPEDPRKMK